MTIQMMKWQLEEWIRDYEFMKREIDRINRSRFYCSGGSGLTATYGIQSVMPKGSRGISQAELKQLDKMEKRLFKYKEIIETLHKSSAFLYTEKSRVIYDCMLDGMSYRAIAKHIGVSRDTMHNMKEEILETIVQKGQEDQSLPLLKLKRNVV